MYILKEIINVKPTFTITSGASMYVEPPAEMSCSTDVSLVTGGVRRMGLDTSDSVESSSGQVVDQAPWTVGVVHSAGKINKFNKIKINIFSR